MKKWMNWVFGAWEPIDVYKRQVQDYTKVDGWQNPEILDVVQKIKTTIQTKEIPDVPAVNFHITDDHLGEGGAKAKFRANMDAIQAVSYTHLDVYKRQILHCCKFEMRTRK